MGTELFAAALGILLFAAPVLFLVAPVVTFVAVVAGFALATDPPARAARNLRRTCVALGAAFLFVPLAVLLESVAPGLAAPPGCAPSDRHWPLAMIAYLGIVATPVALGRTWIRRVAPTGRIAWLMSLAGIATALDFVLVDAVCRILVGCEL